jgi:hypothetical protein
MVSNPICVDALIYKLSFGLGGLNLDGLDVRARDLGFALLETPFAVEGIDCAGGDGNGTRRRRERPR